MFLSATSVSLTQTSVFGVREKKRIAAFWCRGVYAPLCLYSRGQTQRRGLFVLPSSFYSLHHLSRREAMKAAFFIYLLFFIRLALPFIPQSQFPVRLWGGRIRFSRPIPTLLERAGWKTQIQRQGFFFFFLINTRWILCNKMKEIIKDLTRFAIIMLRWCHPLHTMITTLLPLLRRLLLLAGQKIGWDIWGDFQGGGCSISHVSTFFPEWHVVVALVPKRNQLVSTGSLFEGVKKDIFRLRRLKVGVELWNLPRPGTIATEPLHRRKIVATYEEEDAKNYSL